MHLNGDEDMAPVAPRFSTITVDQVAHFHNVYYPSGEFGSTARPVFPRSNPVFYLFLD